MSTSILGKRPRFPEASNLAEIFEGGDNKFTVRDNTAYLAKVAKLSLFTRPTQLGKSTFLSLAEMVYSKDKNSPAEIAKHVADEERNAGYVIKFDFLRVVVSMDSSKDWKENLRQTDKYFLTAIKNTVDYFIRMKRDLREYFKSPPEDDSVNAGDYLMALAEAVNLHSTETRTEDFLVVLVDEFDRPLRHTLLELLNQFEKQDVIAHCKNYVSFFTTCKAVGQMNGKNKVWVTGVLPIVLDLISDFKPVHQTFADSMLDAVGLLDEDVDSMLEAVHEALPFADDEQKEQVREAIRYHANHLQFLEKPLYHTRMVNELMQIALNSRGRSRWINDLSCLPRGVTRERAPSAIYRLLQKSKICREVAKDLVANKPIHGTLNDQLNLPDVCRSDITKNNYLTLLVHLGVASVAEAGSGYVFKATSRYFRSEYLGAMVEFMLLPLFECDSVDHIYTKQQLLQDFVETLPSNGMEKMVAWAASSDKNRILELQFQGFLLGELHENIIADNASINDTQEDKVNADKRSDIQLKGNKTIVILELKQKASEQPPADAAIIRFHSQLGGYIKEVSKQNPQFLVAGFVVVMYANGTKFLVEAYKP